MKSTFHKRIDKSHEPAVRVTEPITFLMRGICCGHQYKTGVLK